MKTISAEAVVAYSQCHRKAFLILHPPGTATTHDYVRLLEEKTCRNRSEYLHSIKQAHPDATPCSPTSFLKGEDILLSVELRVSDLAAKCDLLTKVQDGPSLGRHRYEPTIIVGTHQISKQQKLEALFLGYVLGQLQQRLPAAAIIVDANGCTRKVDMASADRVLSQILNVLRKWASGAPSPPPVILNKHCSLCQFQESCIDQAESSDDLKRYGC